MFVPFKEVTNCRYSDNDLANGLPRFSDSWTFEASGGVENMGTDSATPKDSTLRQVFFFGLWWDFS